MSAIETNGARVNHTSTSGQASRPGRPLRNVRQVVGVGEKVGMVEEEPLDGTLEDDHLHAVVVLKRRDDLAEFQHGLGIHEVERWVVEDDSVAGGRHTDVLGARRNGGR